MNDMSGLKDQDLLIGGGRVAPPPRPAFPSTQPRPAQAHGAT